MTTFTTLVGAVKALVSPSVKAPAASKGEAAPPVKMAPDSVKLTARPADQYANNGSVQLQRAQIMIADALGESRQAVAASQAKGEGSFEDQMVAQAERGGLVRNHEKLEALARLTGRIAANGTASEGDRLALAKLVQAAARGNASEAELGQLLVKAEDVVRNAGRTPASDRGLANATQQVARRLGDVEQQIGDLEGQMRHTNSAEEMQKIQMKLVELNQDRSLLQGFKAQADRLANKRGATPEAVAQMNRLLTSVAAPGASTSPEGLRAKLVDAEFIARHAGATGDRALLAATKAVATKIGGLEAAIKDLTDQAMGDVSSEELQKIQIKLADLGRDRDTMLAIKGQADRVANGRDELDAGDHARLLHDLEAATGTTSPVALYQILGELTAIGR